MRPALLWTLLTALWASHVLAQAESPNWVAPLAELRMAPVELSDAKVSLEQRIALAEALGEHGERQAAVQSLTAALEAEPPPPSLLREAIALSLARRLGRNAAIPEPTARVLRAARARAADIAGNSPVERRVRRLGAAWLQRPRSGASMVDAFLIETDAATLRAMAHKLGQLHLYGLAPPADPHVLSQALCDRQTAPHALLMLAADARRAPSETTRRVLRAALAGAPCASTAPYAPADDPQAVPVRVLGALGLAAVDDASAVPPLRHALRSPYARVRLAAAAALSVLATPKACAALARHAHVENSALVRRALLCTARSRD